MTPSSYLQVNNLACERNNRPLFSHLNLTVKAGELWHIKGANGTGKTSFLRQISGLLPCDQGDIVWHTDKVIYLGHQLAQKDLLTVDENLAWIAPLASGNMRQGLPLVTRAMREEALAQVGLVGYEEVLASQLSAGQRKRLCLARLPLSNAKVWLLDEPMTALDKSAIGWQQQWYIDHLQQGGAIVLSSHQDIDLPVEFSVNTINLDDYLPVLPKANNFFDLDKAL